MLSKLRPVCPTDQGLRSKKLFSLVVKFTPERKSQIKSQFGGAVGSRIRLHMKNNTLF